jgi:c-di-GMP-binding flagellar brake protein YcgR
MANFNVTAPKSDKRHFPRIYVPNLEVSVERPWWRFFKNYHECEPVNLCEGGVGLIASDANLSKQDQVRLKINYFEEEHFAYGVVTFKEEKDGLEFYGIEFNQVDERLAESIKIWFAEVKEQSQSATETKGINPPDTAILSNPQTEAVADPQNTDTVLQDKSEAAEVLIDQDLSDKATSQSKGERQEQRTSKRFNAPGLAVRVRNWGLANFEDFIKGEVADISLGGIGFQATASGQHLTDRVRLEITYKDKVLRAVGEVVANRSQEQADRYSIKYTMVPVKLSSLMKIIAANDRKN